MNKTSPTIAVRVLLFSVVLMLAACQEKSHPKRGQLYVIGNSITLSHQDNGIGWNGTWGMAASKRERDFAHLVAKELKLDVTAINFSQIEQHPSEAYSKIQTLVRDIPLNAYVVIQLGDNLEIENREAFDLAYTFLLKSLSDRPKRVCLSTWWARPDKDEIIARRCFEMGYVLVDIGDVRGIAAPYWRVGREYENAGVNDHPHDHSMAVIADRIVANIDR